MTESITTFDTVEANEAREAELEAERAALAREVGKRSRLAKRTHEQRKERIDETKATLLEESVARWTSAGDENHGLTYVGSDRPIRFHIPFGDPLPARPRARAPARPAARSTRAGTLSRACPSLGAPVSAVLAVGSSPIPASTRAARARCSRSRRVASASPTIALAARVAGDL